MIDVKVFGYLWFARRIKFQRISDLISGNSRQFAGHPGGGAGKRSKGALLVNSCCDS